MSILSMRLIFRWVGKLLSTIKIRIRKSTKIKIIMIENGFSSCVATIEFQLSRFLFEIVDLLIILFAFWLCFVNYK